MPASRAAPAGNHVNHEKTKEWDADNDDDDEGGAASGEGGGEGGVPEPAPKKSRRKQLNPRDKARVLADRIADEEALLEQFGDGT